jgi:hypothetical protein
VLYCSEKYSAWLILNPSPALPFSKGGSNNPLWKRGAAQPGGFALSVSLWKMEAGEGIFICCYKKGFILCCPTMIN